MRRTSHQNVHYCKLLKSQLLQLEQGIYMAPSQYEAGFTSIAHTEEDIDKTIRAAAAVFKEI